MMNPFQEFTLWYGDAPDVPDVIKRTLSLMPSMADRLILNITDSKPTVLFKFDLYGLSTKKAYKANPILDAKEYLECKFSTTSH